MFRIHFSPKLGMFILQVLHMGVWWSTVKMVAGVENAGKPRTFHTYNGALRFANESGLATLYQNKSANTRPGFDRAKQS